MSSEPVAALKSSLASSAEVHWAPVPVHRGHDEWWILEVQARLATPALAEAAIAQLNLPGMLLGLTRRSTPNRADDARLATFKWAIYKPLLAGRFVEAVGFACSFRSVPAAPDSSIPIHIRWFSASA